MTWLLHGQVLGQPRRMLRCKLTALSQMSNMVLDPDMWTYSCCLVPGGMRVALSCIAVAAGGNPRRMSFRNVASARAWGLSGRRVDGRRAHACGRLWFALILFVPGAGIAIAARHFAARTRASASQCPCNATRGRRPGARPFGICCIADGPIVLTFTAIAGCAENRRGVQHHACHPS